MPMSSWSLHYLNARNTLTPFKDQVDHACNEVLLRAERVCDPKAPRSLSTSNAPLPGVRAIIMPWNVERHRLQGGGAIIAAADCPGLLCLRTSSLRPPSGMARRE